MRHLAWTLLVVGTVVGSLGGARLPKADWLIAGAGLAAMVVALVLLRIIARGHRVADGDRERVFSALRALPAQIDEVAAAAPALPLAELASRIGALSAAHVAPIADGAPRLLGSMGATHYAAVFGTFASGERSLARAWSAASDQHRPETLASLALGATRIREAVARLDATDGPS